MTLDEICKMTTNPSVLNTLHACRDGHPSNKPAYMPWYTAWFSAAQRPEISGAARDWLLRQAMHRGEIA